MRTRAICFGVAATTTIVVPSGASKRRRPRDSPGELDREPGDRRPRLALGQLELELAVELVQREVAAHEHAARGLAHEARMLLDRIVLARDIADELFDQVLDRDDAARGAVFVDDDREL
jgi:hypothetical protein